MCSWLSGEHVELNKSNIQGYWKVGLVQAKELPTLKDNDFLNEGQRIQIGDENKKMFLDKLKRDVEPQQLYLNAPLAFNGITIAESPTINSLGVTVDQKPNWSNHSNTVATKAAQLKIMDYSLLVGIHDVDRAEQEEMEVEEKGDEEDCENDGMGHPVGSYGTPPDSPGNMLNFPRIFGPGEFDPTVD
eukprot:g41602.t1